MALAQYIYASREYTLCDIHVYYTCIQYLKSMNLSKTSAFSVLMKLYTECVVWTSFNWSFYNTIFQISRSGLAQNLLHRTFQQIRKKEFFY